MNWIQVQTFADGPHTYVGIEVFLPQRPLPGKKYPLVMLLHSREADRTQWLKSVALERYAENAGKAIVLVQGNQSFYVNSVAGYNWGDYITQELPEKLAGWFPISADPAERIIMGVDMGGYGAIMAAQNAPEAFAQAIAVDPILDVSPLYDTHLQPKPEYIFGERAELAKNGYVLSNQCKIPVVLACSKVEKCPWAEGSTNVTVVSLEGQTVKDRMEETFRMLLEGRLAQ
ncbi:MAG: hypothetical protein IJ315_04560 [Firmicutes bacterium]|nr:hypothetical protein [Bacillota bacterium]